MSHTTLQKNTNTNEKKWEPHCISLLFSPSTPRSDPLTMPSITIPVEAILSDMDGSVIDSTPAVNQTWKEYIERFNLDGEYVMARCHGCRTVENLARFIQNPPLTAEELPVEVKKFEARISEIALHDGKTDGPGKIIALPGAKQLIEQIAAGVREDPRRKPAFAIVTSATAAYAYDGFAAANIGPKPDVFVTSDLVSRGKPAPDPYLLGAELTKSDPKECLVIEDAPPGVVAGKAAGCKVLGLKTTHDARKVWEAGADFVVQDLSQVKVHWEGLRLMVTIEGDERPSDIPHQS
ncbi:unnamed protein product [Sympodiomycopsis kandeliae]